MKFKLIIFIAFNVFFVDAKFISQRSSIVETNTKKCQQWHQAEPDPEIFLAKTRNCPCSVSTAFPSSFHDGLKTWKVDAGCDASKQPNTCQYHQGAYGCYRFAYQNTGPGSQCCYYKNGTWISDPFQGAGTLDRERAPDNLWNVFQWIAHNNHDVIPWDNCCKDSSMPKEICQLYFEKRPPGQCQNY